MNSDCKETEIIVHLGYHLSSPGDSLSEGLLIPYTTLHLFPHHLLYLSPSLPALWCETLPFRCHLGFLSDQLHSSQWNE